MIKKALYVSVLFVWSALAFAQSKAADIELIKAAVKAEYKGGNFSSLEKWIVYGLEEESSQTHPKHKPAMVFLLNGDEVVTHYYVAFDSDLGVYTYSFCNCCHLEEENGSLIAHCEESCTKPPFTKRSQLNKYSAKLKPMLTVYK